MKKHVYSILVVTFSLSLLADFVSCSPVQFTKEQLAPQTAGPNLVSPVSCTTACLQHHQDTTSGPNPQANVLFILDTSGSMTDIQSNLGSYLSGFMQNLSGTDYHVGMITTDVSTSVSDSANNFASSVNANGALQDGRLVKFNDGSSFLTPSSVNAQSALGSIPQIIAAASSCISSGYLASSCLSDDPRAIFAANLLVSSNPESFIRAGVPTTFIIISDADERNSSSRSAYGFSQGTKDNPSTLVSNFKSAFPSTPLKVDAMVIRPGVNDGCYAQRRNRDGNPLIFGFYAPIYASLVSQTGGVLGSVCNSNLTQQIGTIDSAVPASAEIPSLSFSCKPYKGQYSLKFTDSTGAPITNIQGTADLTNQKINLSTPLPANVNAVLSYDCEV